MPWQGFVHDLARAFLIGGWPVVIAFYRPPSLKRLKAMIGIIRMTWQGRFNDGEPTGNCVSCGDFENINDNGLCTRCQRNETYRKSHGWPTREEHLRELGWL